MTTLADVRVRVSQWLPSGTVLALNADGHYIPTPIGWDEMTDAAKVGHMLAHGARLVVSPDVAAAAAVIEEKP